MEYARLGWTGMKVSRICLGCMGFGDAERWVHKWVLNEENSRPIIRKALEMGINFFDTANVYSIGTSEEYLGRALKDFAKRDEVVIATKVHGKMSDDPNGSGLSRKAILREIDKSLKRLETDYVDLYQIHRWDYETPVEETMEALNDVVRAGKARYLGASAMWAWQFQKALHAAEVHGWNSLRLDAGSPEPPIPRRGTGDAATLPRPEDRGDPIQSTGLRKVDARLVVGKHASVRNRSNPKKQIRCGRRDGSSGRRAGRGTGGEARGAARSYRIGLAVAEGAGDGTHRRSDEDLASGRCRRRAVRETDSGRGHIPGRAVCAASHRRPSVNNRKDVKCAYPMDRLDGFTTLDILDDKIRVSENAVLHRKEKKHEV